MLVLWIGLAVSLWTMFSGMVDWHPPTLKKIMRDVKLGLEVCSTCGPKFAAHFDFWPVGIHSLRLLNFPPRPASVGRLISCHARVPGDLMTNPLVQQPRRRYLCRPRSLAEKMGRPAAFLDVHTFRPGMVPASYAMMGQPPADHRWLLIL